MNAPNVYTVAELAEILHIGQNAAYRLVKTGEIRSIHIGRSIRIPESALLDYLNQTI